MSLKGRKEYRFSSGYVITTVRVPSSARQVMGDFVIYEDTQYDLTDPLGSVTRHLTYAGAIDRMKMELEGDQ